jgi:hypothetical protein
MKKSI